MRVASNTPSVPDVAALVETVREALDRWQDAIDAHFVAPKPTLAAYTALSTLASRLEAAERERDELAHWRNEWMASDAARELEAAEAKNKKLSALIVEQEAEYRKRPTRLELDHAKDRARAAEARAQALEEALREIAVFRPSGSWEDIARQMAGIARAALTGSEVERGL